jgi:hypothetical protein
MASKAQPLGRVVSGEDLLTQGAGKLVSQSGVNVILLLGSKLSTGHKIFSRAMCVVLGFDFKVLDLKKLKRVRAREGLTRVSPQGTFRVTPELPGVTLLVTL